MGICTAFNDVSRRSNLTRRGVGAVLTGLALLGVTTGCFRPNNDSSAVRISSVDPLSEPEFDAFAARIAEKLTPLAKSASGQPARLGAPQLVVEDEAWRPSARYFSYALMDGLSDRTAGALSFSRAASDPVQYRTMLMFSTSRARSDRRAVEFVVTDANGSREILRESAEANRAAPPPQMAAAPPPKATPPPPPPDEPVARTQPPAETKPPPPDAPHAPRSERELANTKQSSRSKQARTESKKSSEAQRERRSEEPIAEASVAPPADVPPAEAHPIEPRESGARVKPGKIKIDAKSSEIGAQIAVNSAAYSGRTFTGQAGEVILLDEDTMESFAVAAQRSGRNDRGQLQAQLTLVCGLKSRDAEYRVVFYDDAGEPVSTTPVLNVEFERHERKRITVTAGDSRASTYVWLVRKD